MKITKSYLREIIMEELNKFSAAAEKVFDSRTADEFSLSDKTTIDGVQNLLSTLRGLASSKNTQDTDLQKVVTDADPNIRIAFQKKYGSNINKQTILSTQDV